MILGSKRHSHFRNQGDNNLPLRTLWRDVVDHAATMPDKPAVIDENGSVTFSELVEHVIRLSEGLRDREVSRGDVVGVQLPPIREFAYSCLAAERLGAAVCPMLPSVDGAAAYELVGLARPRLIVTIEQHGRARPAGSLASFEGASTPELVVVGEPPPGAGSMAEVLAAPRPGVAAKGVAVDMGDIAEVAFTSGTSGRPKSVVHSYATATAGILSTLRRQQFTSADVIHVALPVGHNFGYFYGVRLALHVGATLVLQRRWDPHEMLDLAARHSVTASSGPPTFLADLVSERRHWNRKLDSLRIFTCGGAKLRPDLAEEVVATMPGRLSKAFGMTELGHPCSTGPESPHAKLVTTEGEPHPEIELKILDREGGSLETGKTGAIAFRGPFLFLGYRREDGSLDRPFEPDGFFATGDLGYRDEDGYMVVTGRSKNVVIRGGENIPAELVEAVVADHPAVVEAAVVGAPDFRLGERAVACVTVRPGSHVSLEQLTEHMAISGVSRVHWPESLIVLGSIPVSDTGKILRAELKRIVTAIDPFTEEAGDG